MTRVLLGYHRQPLTETVKIPHQTCVCINRETPLTWICLQKVERHTEPEYMYMMYRKSDEFMSISAVCWVSESQTAPAAAQLRAGTQNYIVVQKQLPQIATVTAQLYWNTDWPGQEVLRTGETKETQKSSMLQSDSTWIWCYGEKSHPQSF